MTIIWPNGSPTIPRVTSEFNPNRKHPVTGQVRPHRGIDLVGWSTIVSPVNGHVTTNAYQPGGAGYWVEVVEDGTGHRFRFFHLVRAGTAGGTRVKAGDALGVMGRTGSATGVHLHFEVLVGGTHQNPRTYYANRQAAEAPAPNPHRNKAGAPMIYLFSNNGQTVAIFAHNGGFARIPYQPNPAPAGQRKHQYQNLLEAGVPQVWMDKSTVDALIDDARGLANR